MWQVNRLYPLMGYEQHISKEDFSDSDYQGRYIGDHATVNRMLSLLKSAQTPMFIFTATMGSHGPYSGVAEEITDTQVTRNGKMPAGDELAGYVRSIARLDRAMDELFSGLKNLDYPVVVLLYGDHLPGIAEVQKSLIPND